jgi:hypothetical protein
MITTSSPAMVMVEFRVYVNVSQQAKTHNGLRYGGDYLLFWARKQQSSEARRLMIQIYFRSARVQDHLISITSRYPTSLYMSAVQTIDLGARRTETVLPRFAFRCICGFPRSDWIGL